MPEMPADQNTGSLDTASKKTIERLATAEELAEFGSVAPNPRDRSADTSVAGSANGRDGTPGNPRHHDYGFCFDKDFPSKTLNYGNSHRFRASD